MLTNERLQSVLSLVLAGAPVALAIYHARPLQTLFDATADDALRTAQGHAFGRTVLLAIVAAALLQVAAALVTRRVPLRGLARRVVGAAVLAAALAAVVVGGLAFAAHYGGVDAVLHKAADQFRNGEMGGTSSNGAGRLLSLGNNGRIPMVRNALEGYHDHPVTGSGAGTYRFTNYLYREGAYFIVKHAHDQWVNIMSELGLVGLALYVAGIGGLLVAALRPGGPGARDADRGLLAALQAAAVAFLVHLTVDWDWDMAAATFSFLLFAGVAAAYVRDRRTAVAPAAAAAPAAPTAGVATTVAPAVAKAEPAVTDALADSDPAETVAAAPERSGSPDTVVYGPPAIDESGTADAPDVAPADGADPSASPGGRRPLTVTVGPALRVLATGALALAFVSWLVPALALRSYSDALFLASRGRTAPAIAAAQRAHRLDPLAVDPLFTLALLQQQQGRGRAGLATLERARRLQPYNYAVYYQLGLIDLNVLGRTRAAERAFLRALSLNPWDENTRYELQVARSQRGSP